jgi:hypothetical protein
VFLGFGWETCGLERGFICDFLMCRDMHFVGRMMVDCVVNVVGEWQYFFFMDLAVELH